jgi:HTH-type transcriptional regulator, competence development regulator
VLVLLSEPLYADHVDDVRAMTQQDFGKYLRSIREALGLTLRRVEEKSGRRVKNGYLSQIETGAIQRPSPGILYELSIVYGVDYGELLARAGHRVPESNVSREQRSVAGLPLHAFADLNEDEQKQLVEYAAFIRQRRRRDAPS